MSESDGRIPETSEKMLNMMCMKRRLATFSSWPFNGNDCICTAEKMAEAGFFHCPTAQEPDAVQCCVCLKELDGWDPNDNPREEHKNHSKDCEFLKYHGNPADLSVEEALGMLRHRLRNTLKKHYDAQIEKLKAGEEQAKKQLNKLF